MKIKPTSGRNAVKSQYLVYDEDGCRPRSPILHILMLNNPFRVYNAGIIHGGRVAVLRGADSINPVIFAEEPICNPIPNPDPPAAEQSSPPP
jgi:hypothetical protein